MDDLFSDNIDDVRNQLEKNPVSINEWGIVGRTAVHHHSCEGRLEIVKLLVYYGADIYTYDVYEKDNALTGAIYHNQDHVVDYFITKLGATIPKRQR